jgi:hypothetical protein
MRDVDPNLPVEEEAPVGNVLSLARTKIEKSQEIMNGHEGGGTRVSLSGRAKGEAIGQSGWLLPFCGRIAIKQGET